MEKIKNCLEKNQGNFLFMKIIGIFAKKNLMNHGRCKNCWWYKTKREGGFVRDNDSGKLVEKEGCGICYMSSKNVGCAGAEILIEVKESSYCPDYVNRKKAKGDLDVWIELSGKQLLGLYKDKNKTKIQ